MKNLLLKLQDGIGEMFNDQFGFSVKDLTFTKVVKYLHSPKDPTSLAVTRILFGLAMLFDIPDERGGSNMDKRWGNPKTCHFPLLPFLQPLPMPYMAVVYAALWFGALGIMIGYKYRTSALMFTVSYWYLFLIEKSFWNNHSYLFGLVGLLLSFTNANCNWSLDAYVNPTEKRSSVPYWNYFILKFQFFVLYTMAGLKKGTAEWLTGYSVQRLSEHWVFEPFKLFLTVPQIDYIVVHWFIFVFDLTVAFWMMWSYTRHIAMVFCALFHLMNSRLFRIGMFPWVCLATMPLFYPFDWPKLVKRNLQSYFNKVRNTIHVFGSAKINEHEKINHDNKLIDKIASVAEQDCKAAKINGKSDIQGPVAIENKKHESNNDRQADKTNQDIANADEDVSKNKKITVYLIFFYVLSQLFLPYSHFITKGYNNWTDGLYGYSWDMMVHSWDVSSVVVKVIDNDIKAQSYIDPFFYTPNERWTRHGDMVYQYAYCLRDNIIEKYRNENGDTSQFEIRNISIYIDVWCSMNGRFIQRLFDPKVDLLKTDWSPLRRVSFLMPILDEALHWRKTLDDIREHVNSWSQSSDVIFLADLPGYYQENFIPSDLSNITMTVLKGSVAFEPEVTTQYLGTTFPLSSGNSVPVPPGFHKVLNIGNTPAYYMYTYFNETLTDISNEVMPKPRLPIFQELHRRFQNMFVFGKLLFDGIFKVVFCKWKCY